jgi:hypothetical protein
MLIEIKRYEKSSDDKATIGNLFIDASWECFSLEDKVREVMAQPVETWKIPGVTAIPSGIFPVVIDFSAKFQRMMLHILNVPDFTGVRIHSGNRDTDTEGCVLVGQVHPAHMDFIGSSRLALDALTRKIELVLGLERRIVNADGFVLEYDQVRPPQDVAISITNELTV